MKYIIAEADLTIVDINHSTDRVVQLLDQKGFEEKLGEIYDMLVRGGHDQDIIDLVL